MKQLEDCIEDVRLWMAKNFLKLNDTDTEFIMFSCPRDVEKVKEVTADVGDGHNTAI